MYGTAAYKAPFVHPLGDTLVNMEQWCTDTDTGNPNE